MKTIEKYISPIVKSQFPEFYKEQGPLFILFVEEYFRWLEDNNPLYSNYDNTIADGNVLYHLRRLVDYKDIDTTIDEFLIYFNQKYLTGVKTESAISKRRLIKAAQDIFSAKGSDRSLDLFFKLLYGTRIEVYRPGEDILKLSDGTWVKPIYLELSRSTRTINYVGKQVTGSISGATAFVEYLITRNVNGKIIDIAFLSSLKGSFQTGEYVLDSTIIENAPTMVGSLTSLDITTGGESFFVGEIVDLISSRGIEGKARIESIDSVTGTVRFTIIDGGWGYTNNAITQVSTRVLSVSNVYNTNTLITGFNKFETVSQNLYNFALNNVTGFLTVSAEVNNKDNIDPSSSIAMVVQQQTSFNGSNTANIILNQISSNVFSNTILFEKNKSIISTNNNVLFTPGTLVIQYSGSSNNTTGIVSSVSNVVIVEANTSTIGSNGIHVGTYVEQNSSLANGYISTVTRESNFTFTNVSHLTISSFFGTFNNTDTINIYTDNTKDNPLGSFDPISSIEGYQYLLIDTNLSSNTRWSTSNTVINVEVPSSNTTILVASDIGGIASSCTDVTATANVIGSNTTAIGTISTNNTFYAKPTAIILGLESNTIANLTQVFSGTSAGFNIGTLTDTESLRVSNTFFTTFNDAPGINTIQLKDVLLSGANSKFSNINSVFIYSSGSGYNNTNIVTFSGGNTGAGSFTPGNATLTTDSSGNITLITLSANVGNGIVTTPSISIVNSTGGSTGVGTGAILYPLSSLGFPKLPTGDLSSTILDLINYFDLQAGTIETITNVNPGENYTITPFISVADPLVIAFNKRDYVIEINSVSGGGFINNEVIRQSSNISTLEITSNNFSGNSSNNFEVSEFVYSSDGITNVATGFIYSSTLDIGTNTYSILLSSNTGTWQNTINVSVLTVTTNTNFTPGANVAQNTANGVLVTSNSTTLVVRNVQGTFQANSTNVTSTSGGSSLITGRSNTSIYKITGITSNGTSDIIDTGIGNIEFLARGVIKTGSNTSTLFVKRTSLINDFTVGGTIIGSLTGSTANIASVVEDNNSLLSGLNANITANVSFSNGSILSTTIIDSGLGYENNETVTILKSNSNIIATAKANVSSQGFSEGSYNTTKGFLDDSKFIHDGEYYQNFSYEIQTSIPFEKYFNILKNTLHVAGKKMFGKIALTPSLNANITLSTTKEKLNGRLPLSVVVPRGYADLTFSLSNENILYAWGENGNGLFGDGTYLSRSSPVQIGVNSWTSISCTESNVAGIRSDGALLTWGNNSDGQLGYSAEYNYVASNYYVTAGIRSDGVMFMWGQGTSGMLGDGTSTTSLRSSPVQLGSDSWTAVDCGWSHLVAIRSDGKLFAWGLNDTGQLGDGTTIARSSPVQIGDNSWITVSAGSSYTSAIRSDYKLFTWGSNSSGQLGDGTRISRSSPVQIGTSSWITVSAGEGHTAAIRSDGLLFTWGRGSSGELGNSTDISTSSPVQVGTSSWIAVGTGGGGFTIAIRSDGALFSWGWTNQGQLGDGTNASSPPRSSPVQIGTSSWTAVSVGFYNTGAIRSDGALFTWSSNAFNMLGNASLASTSRSSPVQVGAGSSWISIKMPRSAGGGVVAGKQANKNFFVWGRNLTGNIGDGTYVVRSLPVLLQAQERVNNNIPKRVGSDSWIAASAGNRHTAAIRSDGLLFTWGFNTGGELGDGTRIGRSSPVQIGTNSWTSVGAGSANFTIALRNDNLLFSWGLGIVGQLGGGNRISRSSPVQIGTSSWTAISVGSLHTAAIRSDGLLFTWGFNTAGQLGDNTRITKSSPVQIGTDSWIAVSAGINHTAAIRSDYKLFTWGSNSSGALGDGTSISKSSPVQIGSDSWTAVSVGTTHSAAIRSDGLLFTWGKNSAGQLGNGTTRDTFNPKLAGITVNLSI